MCGWWDSVTLVLSLGLLAFTALSPACELALSIRDPSSPRVLEERLTQIIQAVSSGFKGAGLYIYKEICRDTIWPKCLPMVTFVADQSRRSRFHAFLKIHTLLINCSAFKLSPPTRV